MVEFYKNISSILSSNQKRKKLEIAKKQKIKWIILICHFINAGLSYILNTACKRVTRMIKGMKDHLVDEDFVSL